MTGVEQTPPDAVKARLLPLSPGDAAMERFIEVFPRHRVAAGLVPLDGIAVIDERKGEYKSTGTGCCFVLTLDSGGSRGGWYYVEAALVRHNGSRFANLRVEMADRADRRFDWPITTNLRGSIREVVYLPPNATRLLWFPTGAPGFFSQSPLLVHKISRIESAARRLHRVVDLIGRFRRGRLACPQEFGWWAALTNLQGAYRQIADLRRLRARRNDYPAFLARSDKLNLDSAAELRKRADGRADASLISLLVVLRHPALAHLARTLDSVAGQHYARWELVVCADSSVPPEAIQWVGQRQAADSRIRLLEIPSGASAADCLNQALDSARGEYCAHLGQHDLVNPHALSYIAVALAKHSGADLVYTDEDKVDAFGVRSDPAFKPDWNADLLLSHNYISSMAVYRRGVAVTVGGYRNGFDGAEHYDLLLRLSCEMKPERIGHVAKVLYSRRVLAHEAMTGVPHLSGLRALQEHLMATGATADAGPAECVYRVKHPLPEKLPLVTLIIPTRDKAEVLQKCIESIQLETDYANWEMVVVDNGSIEPQTHRYFLELQQDPRIRVVAYDRPFNYSALNNFAARFAHGEVLGLLNNDLEVISPHWLGEMVSHAIRPGIGAVGAKLLYPDGMVQHAGVVIGIGGVAGHVHRYLPGDDPGYCHRASVTQNLSAVTGACLLVRKALYWEVGGLNEHRLAVAFNDIDFCLKLRDAGYRNLYTPYAVLTHHESISRGRDDTEEKNQTFMQEYAFMQDTWRDKLWGDPAYNPNLTLEFEDCSFSGPA